MLVVAGLSLKNLRPRVWDPKSDYFLPDLRAVMVSYAEFVALPSKRMAAMDAGLRRYLGVPRHVRVFLDNGAFSLMQSGGAYPADDYEEFVSMARPDWYPIPKEYIPTPAMSPQQQSGCYRRTMAVNRAYNYDGFVPVMHIGRALGSYIEAIRNDRKLAAKPCMALGGIVPNLLRKPKAAPYQDILKSLWVTRRAFNATDLHVFGIGGTATVHLASLMGFDSADSSGWRNRAARGLIQLPGSGDRVVAELGSWRGRRLTRAEHATLAKCRCPACRHEGLSGLRAGGVEGFCNRATHNLWVLLEEAKWIAARLETGMYRQRFRRRLDNTIYLPLIDAALNEREGDESA